MYTAIPPACPTCRAPERPLFGQYHRIANQVRLRYVCLECIDAASRDERAFDRACRQRLITDVRAKAA